MLRISADNIHIKGVPGAGCYGHNGADDVAADAAVQARQPRVLLPLPLSMLSTGLVERGPDFYQWDHKLFLIESYIRGPISFYIFSSDCVSHEKLKRLQ